MTEHQKTEEKLLHASALWEALDASGIASHSYARKWLKRQEQEGNIVYPDRTNDQEKRKFTSTQIQEIVATFRPGGSHVWMWPGHSDSNNS